MNLVVSLGPKFTQAHLREIFTVYNTTATPVRNQWEKSFLAETTSVGFDCSLLEWIATEEVTFLFAWIRNLKHRNKSVKVILPYRNEFKSSNYYTDAYLAKLAHKYKDPQGVLYADSEERVNRRRRCNLFLLSVWGMLDNVALEVSSDFENMADPKTFLKENIRLHKNTHKIIPFTPFDLSFSHQHLKYDHHFHEVINDNLDTGVKTGRIFELQNEIKDLLKDYACFSPFESKILSNVITQELYINSLQHSFNDDDRHLPLRECYIAASLNNKWKTSAYTNFVPSFKEEKSPETLDFYKDKYLIRDKMQSVLKTRNININTSREADLKTYAEDYLNLSYLDFTFLDFGQGIHTSLKSQFQKDISNGFREKSKFSKGFDGANLDSQIIEYAFLMDTSRNPLDNTIEYYELVPRGLYFLIDMVRRYKGMLVVHSGTGRVIFDFSDRIYIERENADSNAIVRPTYRIADAIRHIKKEGEIEFPGTMYTLVLPEKDATRENTNSNKRYKANKIKEAIAPVRTDDSVLSNYIYSLSITNFNHADFPQNLFKHKGFNYVSILFLYNRIIEDLRKCGDEIHVKLIYNRLFLEVNKAIDQTEEKNCIIFFDFAGLKTGNPSWIKIIYFLLNTPKINEQTKAIIVNLPTDEGKIIKLIKENLSGKDSTAKKPFMHDPFLYRPIPCLNFKVGIEEEPLIDWVGLKNESDEELLTNLLLGKRESYSLDKIEDSSNIEGNFFVKTHGFVNTTFSEFPLIKEIFFAIQQEAITKFMGDYVEGGNKDENGEMKHVYMASNGGYQFRYLSLYELLHDKYVATYFAKCLLDKFCYGLEKKLRQARAAYKQGKCPDQDLINIVADSTFKKIIAVTVSSQLIGIAIRDLIANDENYSVLKCKREDGAEMPPELIMLSNYYSFDKEKPFEKIERDDTVIIVNDVISTGKLVGKLINQMQTVKEIPVAAVFSIVDSRIRDEDKEDKENEMDSLFFKTYERAFITLCSYENKHIDERIVIRKYKAPYIGNSIKKRINPLLNTVVELKAIHGEQHKVLIRDLKDILSKEKISNDCFKIGHFQQNLTHNAYITNMRSLFSDKEGVRLLERLKKEIETMHSGNASNVDYIKIKLVDISERADSIAALTEDSAIKENLKKIKSLINTISEDAELKHCTVEKSNNFSPDFIFYPHFSGIERISHSVLNKIFDTHPDNIIGLQRFDTPKGWRFPFPAKRFNELTKNKTVLILDSGSLTGESLVQLIDNIGFLDVRKLTVLSVITRVDDFYREFYSRLRSMKVKRLKSKLAPENSPYDEHHTEHIIPIEVIFGINLHIPVYPSSVSCSFCTELKMFKNIQEAAHPVATNTVNEYIGIREEELRVMQISKQELQNIDYLPVKRNDKQVDTKSIFYIRDLLGKIDSYRFYPDYFDEFEQLEDKINNNIHWMTDKDIIRDIECIMVCILHEPVLFNLVNNLINGIEIHLKKYLRWVLFSDGNFNEKLFYEWKIYALVRLGFIIAREDFMELSNFEHILGYGDRKTETFLHYQYWDIIYHPDSYGNEMTKVDVMLREFGRKMQENKDDQSIIYRDIHHEFYRLAVNRAAIMDVNNYKDLDLPFRNLSTFVLKGNGEGRHFVLKEKLNNLYESVESTAPSLKQIKKCLKDVLYQFDYQIKPSIKKILEDSSLKNYVNEIYRYLSAETHGILFYILAIEEVYNKLRHCNQEDTESLKSSFREISQSCEALINTILVQDEEECFFEICNQYPCELTSAIEKLKERVKGEHTLTISRTDEKTGNVYINHHTTIFTKIINQLIDNAVRIYKDKPLEIDLKYEVSEQLGTVSIIYSQNQPFKKSDKEGGLEHIVKHYVKRFKGGYRDNRSEDTTQFAINIRLFLYNLEEDKSYKKIEKDEKKSDNNS